MLYRTFLYDVIVTIKTFFSLVLYFNCLSHDTNLSYPKCMCINNINHLNVTPKGSYMIEVIAKKHKLSDKHFRLCTARFGWMDDVYGATND